MKKYIVTIETSYGTEHVCQISPKQDVATEEDVREFLSEYKAISPNMKYRVYTIKEVILPYT